MRSLCCPLSLALPPLSLSGSAPVGLRAAPAARLAPARAPLLRTAGTPTPARVRGPGADPDRGPARQGPRTISGGRGTAGP